MSINSESIQKKEFHVVFKGYKPEEVDSFLDILAVEFERLQRAYRELKNNVERLKYEGNKESTEMKKVIQEALVSAHRIAEDIKKKAEKEAEEIVKTKVIEEEESYKKLLRNKLQLEKEIEDLDKEYEGFKGKISKLVDDFKEAASRLEENKFLNISRTGKEDINFEESGMKEDLSVESKEEKELIYSGEDESETSGSTEGVIEEEVTEEEDSEKIEFEPFKGKEETEGKELRESGFEDIFEEKEELREKEDSEKIEFEPFKGKEETEEKDLRESGFEEFFEEKEELKKEDSEKIEFDESFEEKEEKEDEQKEEQEDEQKEEKQRGNYEDFEETEETGDYYKPKRVKKKIDIANPDIINDFFKTDED
ncbi:MAG: hypothetical protein A2Z35_02185 [Actinobacteria bacterium RBG_19FT_COMBO_36_27]|nr:MAG: hypothetical protein A2Z35_02185 [Actinobacteria bacterium RBG_19FT_COMBO_36_27]